MRARITLLLLFAILFSFTCLAQTNFEKHFTKKSLRIDFALSGNHDDLMRQKGKYYELYTGSFAENK